jgi:hypothetical protein
LLESVGRADQQLPGFTQSVRTGKRKTPHLRGGNQQRMADPTWFRHLCEVHPCRRGSICLIREAGPLQSASVPSLPRAFGGHSPRPLRGNFRSASKLSAALWSKTAARCLAFSSGHTSTVDSIPFRSIRTTCHPKALASYRSRFILRICAPTRPFSSPN